MFYISILQSFKNLICLGFFDCLFFAWLCGFRVFLGVWGFSFDGLVWFFRFEFGLVWFGLGWIFLVGLFVCCFRCGFVFVCSSLFVLVDLLVGGFLSSPKMLAFSAKIKVFKIN